MTFETKTQAWEMTCDETGEQKTFLDQNHAMRWALLVVHTFGHDLHFTLALKTTKTIRYKVSAESFEQL